MRKIWKKILAHMLAVTICFSAVEIPVYAQGYIDTEVESDNTSEAVTDKVTVEETVSDNDAETTTEDTVNTEEETTAGTDGDAWDQITTENFFEGENYKVTFTLTSYWDTGYNANITLENTGDITIQNWYLGFDNNNSITNIWNAEIYSNEENEYIIKNVGWNQDIAVGNRIEFGISGDQAFRGFPENYELIGTSTEASKDDYVIQYHVDGDWGTGFYGSISVTNNTGIPFEDWVLEFDFDREITDVWNGVIEEHEGNHYVIRNAKYNSSIAPGESISIGMMGCGGALSDEPGSYALYSSGIFSLVRVVFDACADNVNNVPSEQTISSGECVNMPASPTRDGYIFVGWYLSESYEEEFDFETKIEESITLYARWFNYTNNADTDGDGVIDELEVLLGTNPDNADTDGDGLSDYDEIAILFTDPLKEDTDDNGIEDGDEDYDGDGLTNKFELNCGSDPTIGDTDGDQLNDYDEVYKYKTNVILRDTDEDGVSDGKEVELGTDPLVYQSTFNINATAKTSDSVIPSVEIELTGKQVETLSIDIVEDDLLFPKTIPGYIGAAYDFSVAGTFNEAVLNFQFDENLLENEGFDPVIYYFNKAEQQLEPLETSINGNVASAKTNHFSTYILINRTEFEESRIWISEWNTKGFSGVEVVLVIDDFTSMPSNDTKYRRLALTQDLIDHLPTNSKVGVVKCDTFSTVLTSSMTSDKEEAKKCLTSRYFKSSGNTYIYKAIDRAFNLFESTDDTVLKIIVVLTDNNTFDTNLYSSIVINADERNIELYTVVLGNSGIYLKNDSKPSANSTKLEFYLASNANQLEDIYTSITDKINTEVDIEKDSDNDGIPDYYEDNLVLFNNTTIKLDKNNPDSDGDGLTDGQEVVELRYEYNEDRSKVRVTGKLLSNPLNADTDGDLDIDSIDPEPFDYQLNDLLCYNLCKLNELAIEYKKKNHYGSGDFNTKVETWLTFMFIRQFNSSYIDEKWDGIGKSIDTGFVEYVKNENPELYAYFETKPDFYANDRGETGDLYHLAATATGYIYNSDLGDGFELGIMPEYHLNNLSGWAGDLQTAMNDAMVITGYSKDYDVFKSTMRNLIGYDADVNDIYAGKSHTFDIDDVYADTDAYNLYKILKAGKTMEEALDSYYKTGYLKRYSKFTNYWDEATIKEKTFVYTQNKYLLVFSWPLLKYTFNTIQSLAARDAFAEFLLERRKCE